MVSNCSLEIYVPYADENNWMRHSELKSSLSRTISKTIRFVDKRDQLWETCLDYLDPIRSTADDRMKVDELAWSLYLLMLATKYRGEVVLPPEKVKLQIYSIKKGSNINQEAKARLAKIEGIFNCFDSKIQIPSLTFRKHISKDAISNRIDDICEDAYLLEASALRKFIGYKSNRAAIVRDLRKIIRFISKSRNWAKGIVNVGSANINGSESAFKIAEHVVDILPDLQSQPGCPALLDYDTCFWGGEYGCIEVVKGEGGHVFRFDPQEWSAKT